jgi:hypothetical protein
MSGSFDPLSGDLTSTYNSWNTPGFGDSSSLQGDFQSSPGSTITAGTPPAAGDSSSWWSKNAKYLGLGIPAAGLGIEALLGNQAIPNQNLLQTNAKSLIGNGQTLMNPLINNAPLPTGAEASIQGASQGQKAAIISNAAATGQLGSSATQQALQQADINAQAQRFQMATSLYTLGAQEVTQGDQQLMNLGSLIMKQDQGLQTALAGIASSASGVLFKDIFGG